MNYPNQYQDELEQILASLWEEEEQQTMRAVLGRPVHYTREEITEITKQQLNQWALRQVRDELKFISERDFVVRDYKGDDAITLARINGRIAELDKLIEGGNDE